MIKVQKGSLGIRPMLAFVGATILACAFAAPALAVTTVPAQGPGLVPTIYHHTGQYDLDAPLAGLQYAGDDVQPLGDESAQQVREQEQKQQLRDQTRRMNERDSQRDQRIHERAEQQLAEQQMAQHEQRLESQRNADQVPDNN
jgi:flagellar motility protein MotE (MotC chaperone)